MIAIRRRVILGGTIFPQEIHLYSISTSMLLSRPRTISVKFTLNKLLFFLVKQNKKKEILSTRPCSIFMLSVNFHLYLHSWHVPSRRTLRGTDPKHCNLRPSPCYYFYFEFVLSRSSKLLSSPRRRRFVS